MSKARISVEEPLHDSFRDWYRTMSRPVTTKPDQSTPRRTQEPKNPKTQEEPKNPRRRVVDDTWRLKGWVADDWGRYVWRKVDIGSIL